MNSFFVCVLLFIASRGFSQTSVASKVNSDSIQEESSSVQEIIIKGQIVEQDQTPLAHAIVSWASKPKAKAFTRNESDVNGIFTVIIPNNLRGRKIRIKVNAVGHVEKTVVLEKKELPVLDLTIVLKPSFLEYGF